MSAGPWSPTHGLRFVDRSTAIDAAISPDYSRAVLQQRWKREVVEHREVAGRTRRWASMEHEWRDVPLEKEEKT